MRRCHGHLADVVLSATLILCVATESNAALGIQWAPTEPEIGEDAIFTLSGLNGDITRVTWNFGGTGCDGAAAEQVCVPSIFNDCTAMSFRFASGGAKSVTVEVELQVGGTQSAGPITVNISFLGSCDGPNVIFIDGFETGDRSVWSSSEPAMCLHDPCESGAALDTLCSACVEQICSVDPYCCDQQWDRDCVDEVWSVCGLACN